MRLVVISGLSGAGKGVALHALEDLGFHCVDNLPACNGNPGWYFEPDITQPEYVTVCPATCTQLETAKQAEVDIIFPCELPPEHVE